MSYTYSDYVTYDRSSATRLSRLRLHIQEVSDKLRAEVASDGKSLSTQTLQAYLSELRAEEAGLEQHPSRAVNGGMSRIRAGRPV